MIVPGFIEVEIAARIEFFARLLVGHIHGGAQRRRALLIGECRQFRGRVMDIFNFVRVGIGHAGSSVRIIIPNGDRAGPLRDGRQSVGIVNCHRCRRLASGPRPSWWRGVRYCRRCN